MFKEDNSKMSFRHLCFSFELGGGGFLLCNEKANAELFVFHKMFISLVVPSAETEAYVTTFNSVFSFIIV